MLFDWYWWLVIGLAWVGTVAAGVWAGYHWGWREAEQQTDARSTQRPVQGLTSKKDSNPIVCPPPMVGDETVMQWGLRTYKGRLGERAANADPEYGVWSLIVADMYRLASQDIGVARHFNFTHMAALQKKFTATLVLVLDKGLRRKSIEAMEKVHRDFDITPAEYDRVVAILVGILQHYRVPEQSYPAITKIVETLKPVIVKPVRVA
jgi:hypothetical protein